MCFLVAVTVLASFRQSNESAICRDELKSIVRETTSAVQPVENNVYHLNITVKTKMSQSSKVPDSNVTIDILQSAGQFRYSSTGIETFQDKKDAFAVLTDRKTIMWAQGGKREDADVTTTQINQMLDTLISLSSVTKCDVVAEKGQLLKSVVLEPGRRAKELYKVARMEYVYDPKNKKLLKANTFYLNTEDIAMRSIVYNDLDFNYKKVSLKQSVYFLFFDSKGNLLPKYKGYKLIDKRN
jgi:hypothetical protein